MKIKLHDREYDELEGCFIIHDQHGNTDVKQISHMVKQIDTAMIKTSQYGDFDETHDFSFIDKTIMKKG